jgi:hypothetical protein
VAEGQVEQQGIGELIMTGDSPADFVTYPGKAIFERPEMVRGAGDTLRQGVHSVAKQNRHFDYSRLQRESHEGQLGERAGRPSRATVFLKPLVCGSVVNVRGPCQGKEDIDVEQEYRHPYPIGLPESIKLRPTSKSSRSIARATSSGPKEGVPAGT